MTSINLTPDRESELLPLRNMQGAGEANIEGRSYVADEHGIFWIERRHFTAALSNVGGFFVSAPTKIESLRTIATAIYRMPASPEKTALNEAMASLISEPIEHPAAA